MKVLVLLLTVTFCFLSSAQAAETLTTKTEAIPKIFQVSPRTTATLAASRWMQFSDCNGGSACCDTMSKISSQYKGGAPTYIGNAPEFEAIPDLVLSNVATENADSVLITWTMRIEGSGKAINPQTNICGMRWGGTVTETFKGGQVYSQAYVDYGNGFQAVGREAGMTIPDAGAVVEKVVMDPTHSGSCVLKAADAPGGKFPATIKVQIYWKNDSSLLVTSKADYRSLIVTVLPASSNN